MPTLMAVLISLLLSASAPQQGADEAMKRLRGTWYLLWTADERRTDPGSPSSRMEIGAGGVAFKIDKVVTNRGEIRLGSTGKLRTIDLKMSDGRTLLGVYELKDDELTICFAEAGQPRPAGVKPKGTQWAELWKRERL